MSEKITITELRILFGERLPIEAAMILFPKEPHGLSTDEIRAELRKLTNSTSAMNSVEAVEKCAKIADAYAEENFRMAGDTVMVDPVLAKYRSGLGNTITERDWAISADEQANGLIHSSMAHAAQNIAAAIRATIGRGAE